MNNRSTRTQLDRQVRLISLFLIGLLFFNFPMLGIFEKEDKWGAIPGLYIYIAVVWIGLILASYWVMRDISSRTDRSDKTPPQ